MGRRVTSRRVLSRRRIRRTLAALTGLLLAGSLSPAQTAVAAAPPATYTNPVTAGTVDTFPDPTMIRGKDGHWYAYGTQNPVFQTKGETAERMLPILRSSDMTHWEYAGQVFTPGNQPAWHGGSRLWAPDIRYGEGRYDLYYSVPGKDTVGVATAPTPTGPWTDEGAVLPADSGCATGDIDEAQFTDVGGQPYLYWGSYDTICVAKLNGDRTRVEGPVTEVAQGRRMEGGFVVHRGRYYYLFYSDAGCCDGAFSGYQVKVGRATSPTGPFTDDRGVDLMAPTSKGGVVVAANGGRWIGPGHNALQTDLSGQDWLVYHAIPADDPDLDPVPGLDRTLSRRPMLIDRLDWIDGWPVVRAGAGPSDGTGRAPVTRWDAGSTFNDGSTSGWRAEGSGAWTTATDQDSGGYVTHGGTTRDPSYLVTASTAPARVRAEADLRVTSAGSAAGLLIGYTDPRNYVVARLDRRRQSLVTDARVDGVSAGERSTPLPSGFRWTSWRNVAAELRGTHLTVEVGADRLRDPVAVQRRTVPAAAAHAGRTGVAARGPGVAADNVGAARLWTPVTKRVPQPTPGSQLASYSDEFEGGSLSPKWTWVRGPAAGAAVGDGALSWPTQNAELNLATNTASVLTRPAPSGDFIVETRLRLTSGPANQQAGLVLYGDDDRYFKLVHAVLPLGHTAGKVTHVTEFAKEGPRPTTTPPTAVAYGPMFGGPAAGTLWMRMAYHADTAAGEHEVHAATSTDGVHWTWTGVWTLPAEQALRIGLVSMNSAGATAHFDYVRTYRSTGGPAVADGRQGGR